MIARLGLDARSLVVELGQQRRLPAAALRRARASRCLGDRAGRATSPRPREAQGVPTLTEFFGRDARRGARRRSAGRPTSSSATTSSPRSPTSTTSSPGSRDPARAGRRRDDRVPAPRAADRGQPVRHDLPRALLVLLAARRSARIVGGSRPRGRRRRGAADPRRLAPGLRSARRGRPGDRRRPRRRPRCDERRRSATRTWRATPASRSGSARRSASLLTFLIEARRAGQSVAGYGAPGKGNTLLNYCGIRTDLARLHRRPEPVQARPVHAGHAHPDLPARADRRDPAGLRPDPAVEPARGDRRPARRTSREWGARFVVPIPTSCGMSRELAA